MKEREHDLSRGVDRAALDLGQQHFVYRVVELSHHVVVSSNGSLPARVVELPVERRGNHVGEVLLLLARGLVGHVMVVARIVRHVLRVVNA